MIVRDSPELNCQSQKRLESSRWHPWPQAPPELGLRQSRPRRPIKSAAIFADLAGTPLHKSGSEAGNVAVVAQPHHSRI